MSIISQENLEKKMTGAEATKLFSNNHSPLFLLETPFSGVNDYSYRDYISQPPLQ